MSTIIIITPGPKGPKVNLFDTPEEAMAFMASLMGVGSTDVPPAEPQFVFDAKPAPA